jgi:hypothetical protein
LRRYHQDEIVVTHSSAPDPDLKRVQAALDHWANSVAEQLLTGKAPKATSGPRTPARRTRYADEP